MIHPLVDPLHTTALGRDRLVERAVISFETAADLAGYDLGWGAGVTGTIVVAGHLYLYDASDLTTVADGVVVVVDGMGRRFKAVGLEDPIAVQSVATTTPPPVDATTWGKAWLVPPAATGSWAAHADDIAISSPRGWIFLAPRVGGIVYDRETDRHWSRRASGIWAAGLGSPATGEVRPDALEFPLGLTVQARDVAAPPVTTTRAAWIVPSGATGAWASHVGQIAVGSSAGWDYLSPLEGSTVWVAAEGKRVTWLTGAWSTDVDAAAPITRMIDASTLAGAGTYAYSTTAPTAANTATGGLSIAHAAKGGGAILRLRWQGVVAGSSAGTGTVALFVDAAAVAVDWVPIAVATTPAVVSVEFLVTASDALSHAYAIRHGAVATSISHRHLTLEEFKS